MKLFHRKDSASTPRQVSRQKSPVNLSVKAVSRRAAGNAATASASVTTAATSAASASAASVTSATSASTAATSATSTANQERSASQNLPAVTRPINGRRNLLILGCGAILLALLTTALELWIYRSSGDIYLDRSRPGFLPDADEVIEDNDDSDTEYSYSDSGIFDKSELTEYLAELEAIKARIDKIKNPYSADPLSDSSLGIISAEEIKQVTESSKK